MMGLIIALIGSVATTLAFDLPLAQAFVCGIIWGLACVAVFRGN
jgi:hypothetical protein